MTSDQVRAEAKMCQQEAGGEITTRTVMLYVAATQMDRAERFERALKEILNGEDMTSLHDAREAARIALKDEG
jgi:hypothetical protein